MISKCNTIDKPLVVYMFSHQIMQFLESYIRVHVSLSLSIVQLKAMSRMRYNQVPHLTRDTIWESDKNTRKINTEEMQIASPFSVGDYKYARDRQDNITKTIRYINNRKDPHKKYPIGPVCKKENTGWLKHV